MANKFILPVFWALIGLFIIIVLGMTAGVSLAPLVRQVTIGTLPRFLFFLLGLALIVLTARAEIDRTMKKFLILTGSSAVGLFVGILLHNLVYGAFVQWFGADFWDRTGLGDEPVFFLLAVLVCPVAFMVGTVASIVLMIQRKSAESRLRET